MAKKLPSILRKEYTTKSYRKRLLSRVHTEKGRKLLAEHFAQGDDGVYRPASADGVTEDEARNKELARLAKEIKKNRSAVRKGRVTLVLVVLGGIVAFNLIFKNLLLERGAELGLEEAFRAEAHVDNLRFSAFRGTLTIDAIRVADRESPMENLFEVGPLAFRMIPVELLKGNVVIEEIAAESLRFGTPRERSGALPRFADAGPQAGSGDTGAGTPEGGDTALAAGSASGLLSGGVLDPPNPRELVAAYIAESESLSVVEALRAEAREAQSRWESRVDELQEDGGAAAAEAAALREIEPGEIDTVEEALAARERVDQARARIQDVTREIEAAAGAVREDLAAIRNIDDALGEAVESDIDALLGRLPGFEGGVEGLVMGLIHGFLEERLGALYAQGQRGLSIYRRLQSDGETAPRGAGRRGTVVSFPSAEYPRFYLGVARASVGNPEEGTFGEGSVEYLSSEPGMVPEAPRLAYGDRRDGRRLEVEAVLPAVQGGDELAEISVSLAGADIRLPGGLSQGVFESLSAKNDAAIRFRLGRGGRGSGTIDLLLSETTLSGETPEDPIRRALRAGIAGAESISFAGDFAVAEGRIVALAGSSNLAQILSDSVARLLREQREVYEARLREELAGVLEERLAVLREEQGRLGSVVEDAEALLRESESWSQVVAETDQEVRRRLEGLRGEATQQLRQEAEERGRDAVDRLRNRF